MNQRITIKHLERKADLLNKITGSPAVPYTRTEGGELVACAGNYHISGAYGGYQLERMAASGGVSIPVNTGHVPARQCALVIDAYIAGINAARADA